MENAIIKVLNVSKIFKVGNDEVVALKDINLFVEKGKIFGIIGLSGAGKSTLVRIMNLLEKPTSGSVFFEDKNLELLNKNELREIRKDIGMIFQNFNLLEQRTVIQNVMFPLELSKVINGKKMSKQEKIDRAMELLRLVDLDTKANTYPSKLSGGQKQRVAIARALATNPKVLLCDEATSALDPNTTEQILSLLKKINEELGVTIVVITHQMSVIENICDVVTIIDHSMIAEVGEVKDVFKKPKSDIGKKLIFGSYVDNINELNMKGEGKKLRITFDGTTTNEPILANMILKAGVPCNILYANAKAIDNNVVGEMIVELPKDNIKAKFMEDYLKENNIVYWEVE